MTPAATRPPGFSFYGLSGADGEPAVSGGPGFRPTARPRPAPGRRWAGGLTVGGRRQVGRASVVGQSDGGIPTTEPGRKVDDNS